MKTLRMIGMALFAVLMCVNFASCSNDDGVENQEPQKCTISIGCTGEILDIINKPLSRAGEEETGIYTVVVRSEGKIQAEGSFKSMDNLTVDLIQGVKYSLEVTYHPDDTSEPTEKFDYTLKSNSSFMDDMWQFRRIDAYFGYVNEYTAIANGTVDIFMKRVSFGLNITAKGLPENASVKVNLSLESFNQFDKICELTKDSPDYDGIHVFHKWNYVGVYNGKYEISEGKYVNYYNISTLQIILKRTDGREVILAEESITLERNKKTFIKINIGQSADITSGGIKLEWEEEDLKNGTGYEVNGDEGTIVETEINTES